MNRSPLIIVSAAGLVTLMLGQMWLPTVKAQSKSGPDYCVRIERLKTKRTAGGLEITGRIINTGKRTLTYTSVMPLLMDGKGKEVGRGTGYLTTGPVGPEQTAEFRACEPIPPLFTHVQMLVRERGLPVIVVRD